MVNRSAAASIFYLALNRVKLSDVLQGLRCNLDLVADMQVKEL
jgi:hypothetical protein